MGKRIEGAAGGWVNRIWPVVAGIVALGLGLRFAAYSPFDIMHADELMQYLEQGNRLATGHGIIPWEARYGVRNGLIEQFLAPFLWLGYRLAPGTLLPLHLARIAFEALTLCVFPAAWRLGRLTSPRHALVALFVAAVWWESVLFSELLLSESLASALLLLAAAPLLAPLDSGMAGPRSLFSSGFLLVLGILIRLQYAPFAAVLALGALRRDWVRWKAVALGGLLALLLGAASDLIAGRMPLAWVLINLALNIGHGVAARFGVSGPTAYLTELYVHLAPFSAAIMVAAFLAGGRYWPLLAAALANLLVHSLIAHKEYRFIWLTTLTLVLLAAIATAHLVDHVAKRRAGSAVAGASPGALAALCLIWAGASFLSEHVSGGFRAFRGGGAIARLAIDAAADPRVCAVGIDFELKAHVVPSLLTRQVPLSLVPPASALRGEPLPPELANSVNALIQTRAPNAIHGYRRVSCLPLRSERVCLYRRAGQCLADETWSYQRLLDRTSRL